jgi:glycosyltransferase involved in cell wall biosynthesis
MTSQQPQTTRRVQQIRTGGRPLRVLTWHVHGSYLWYLARTPVQFVLPVRPGRPEGYGGRAGSLPWPPNVEEVAAEAVADGHFDLVLFQSHRNWEVDQEILSPEQRRGPRVFLEHDPPRASPTDTRHPVADTDVHLVHVTHFNELMWDAGSTTTHVIEHGVTVPPGVEWSGELDRGLVVVNGLATRGRRLGADVFERVRAEVPLDLVGMGSEQLGGLGEVPLGELASFAARYRFFFNPIRYTSLGLAICEAMMVGLPVVGLATTELVTVVRNGESGFVSTDVGALVREMQRLIDDHDEAARLGIGARKEARRRFGIERFAAEWRQVFERACAR